MRAEGALFELLRRHACSGHQGLAPYPCTTSISLKATGVAAGAVVTAVRLSP